MKVYKIKRINDGLYSNGSCDFAVSVQDFLEIQKEKSK